MLLAAYKDTVNNITSYLKKMALALTHKTHDKGHEVIHLVMEVNQNVQLTCTQEECPFWNDYQKDCDMQGILELDYEKLLKLLKDRGLNPKPERA